MLVIGHCWTKATPSVNQRFFLSTPWTWIVIASIRTLLRTFNRTSAPRGTTIGSPGLKNRKFIQDNTHVTPLIAMTLLCNPSNTSTSAISWASLLFVSGYIVELSKQSTTWFRFRLVQICWKEYSLLFSLPCLDGSPQAFHEATCCRCERTLSTFL